MGGWMDKCPLSAALAHIMHGKLKGATVCCIAQRPTRGDAPAPCSSFMEPCETVLRIFGTLSWRTNFCCPSVSSLNENI